MTSLPDFSQDLDAEQWTQVAALLSHFCQLADSQDAHGLSVLFAPRGRLEVAGEVHTGASAIRQALALRLPAGRNTRHLWTCPQMHRSAQGGLVCRHTQITYEVVPGRDAPQTRVSDVCDHLVRSEGGALRIEARQIHRVFNW